MTEHFGPFDGVWLNCAHQGPLPHEAAAAAREAIETKRLPHRIEADAFERAPAAMRHELSTLLGVDSEDVILGNSATYGLQQVVHGFPWRAGDEIVLVRGDFPATLIPWLILEERGVIIKWIDPRDGILAADAVRQAIGPRTRVMCTTWVHSFLGHAVDLAECGMVCRERDVAFVVNASQGLGSLPLNLSALPVDVLTSCGHKFLCGPYGTGVCWIRPDFRDRLRTTQAYWLAHIRLSDLEETMTPALRPGRGARAFDVFASANFFNCLTWSAAVRVLRQLGIGQIHQHVQRLVSRLLDGLSVTSFDVVSPRAAAARSALVVVRHDPPMIAAAAQALSAERIGVAVRQGRIRLSPHAYNTDSDIDCAVAVFQEISRRSSAAAIDENAHPV